MGCLKRLGAFALTFIVQGTLEGQAVTSIPNQVVLGTRSAQMLTVEGLRFKDLDHNGRLDAYEDWRLDPATRTEDLLRRLSLDELAGQLVHGTLQRSPAASPNGNPGYDINRVHQWIFNQHVTSFVTRLDASPTEMAAQNNRIQELAEGTPFGIPLTISSDPKLHHVYQSRNEKSSSHLFSLWPEPIGFAAIADPLLIRKFGDTVRQEYMAVGIRESLAPQADLATEPRWTRTSGTFGENADLASRLVEAYVTGVQNGEVGLGRTSVAAVVKHWAGYGAAKNGWDSHNSYGRYSAFEGQQLAYHLKPYEGAFRAHVGGVMPSYSILEGVILNDKPVEQVGVAFSRQMLQGLLRNHYHFDGVVLSDWLTTKDCSEACRGGSPAGVEAALKDAAMPWGVEGLTKAERFAKTINAGVDQIGGTEESNLIVEDVRNGLIPEWRVREAARRVLLQKFELGLFEQPYVDESRAGLVAGNPQFIYQGEAAQAKAVVLLKNSSAAPSQRPLLPLRGAGQKLYLYGVDPKAAEAVGFKVVGNPAEADVVLIHAPAPFESEHPNFFFGARQHEGRLHFTKADPGYRELLRASKLKPVIFVTTLERPLILTNTKPYAAALLGDFGISDGPLMSVITGKAAPEGRLPFELPSSEEAVRQQRSDLPHDSVNPLYPIGFGLRYGRSTDK